MGRFDTLTCAHFNDRNRRYLAVHARAGDGRECILVAPVIDFAVCL
jgi:hypothetical protein